MGKVYNRSRRSKALVPLRAKWTNPVPHKGNIRFKYCDNGFNVSTAAALYSVDQVLSGNSPYDPDYTGIGVQPYGWDQMMGANLFNQYNCLASKIVVRVYLADAESTGFPVTVSLFPLIAAAPAYIDKSDLRAIPYCKQVQLTPGKLPCATMTHYCTTRRMYSTAPMNTREVYSTNPGTRWYWHLVTDSSDQSVAVDVYADVQITYYTQVFRTDDVNES